MYLNKRNFIGRISEIKRLEEIYASSNFEFGIIYGRRRIGKSTLLKEFIQKKNAIYLVANEKKIEFNLNLFANEISKITGNSHIKFSSFSDMMTYVFETIKTKMILIIDEFTYLVSNNKAILSELQNAIDKYRNDSMLKLIISGSHVGMVEDMLAYKKPLYARKTFALKLKEFDYLDASLFFPKFSYEDKIRIYALCGGIPYYLQLFDDSKTLKENIINIFIRPHASLENELDFLFQSEFRKKSVYSSILQVVANGKTKLNDISQLSHINDTAKTSTYLKPLIEMELIKKEFAFKASSKRRTIYKIKNNLVNFVYTFLEENRTSHNLLNPDDFYDIFIEQRLDEYVSLIFEDICIQYLIKRNKIVESSEKVIDIGHYWLNDNKSSIQIEIDICTKTLKDYIIYECKWTNSKVDIHIMFDLENKSQKINDFTVKGIGAFSKSGFTTEVKEKYARIFDLNDLFS